MNRQSMLRGNGFAVSRDLNPVLVPVERLKPLGRETRKHPPSQIRKLESSIEEFGFVLEQAPPCLNFFRFLSGSRIVGRIAENNKFCAQSAHC